MLHFDVAEYGKRIKDLREQKHMTQSSLAEAVGYSDSRQIQRIEAGESAGKVDVVVELSQALNVSMDYLLCGKKDSASNKIIELLSDKTPDEQEFAYRMLLSLFSNKDLLVG
jgi:transcriptional regulator with XRE-family HTH domain